MEQLFNEIQRVAAEGMPQLLLVDEDYGQLETAEETYPVTFPCVLINIRDIEWTSIVGDSQRGTATIGVKLCLDCYDDTHYTSGTAHKVAERVGQFRTLNGLISNLRIEGFTSLVRKSSRWYSLPGNIKVYESLYECVFFEEPS